MAENDESVEELQKVLEEKRVELSQLRADVQAAKDKAVSDVAKAQLRAEIAAVDAQIELEKGNLQLQEAQNPDQVGAGIQPETPPELPTVPVDAPQNPQSPPQTVEGLPNVDPVTQAEVNDDTPKGDEN